MVRQVKQMRYWIVDPNAVLARAVPGELLQAVARRCPQIVDIGSRVDQQQSPACDPLNVLWEFLGELPVKDSLGPFVGERFDHPVSITHRVNNA